MDESFSSEEIEQLRLRLGTATGLAAAALRYIISTELSVWERNHVDRDYTSARDALLGAVGAVALVDEQGEVIDRTEKVRREALTHDRAVKAEARIAALEASLSRVAHEVTVRLDESVTESTGKEAVIESPVVAPEAAEHARVFAKLDQEVWSWSRTKTHEWNPSLIGTEVLLVGGARLTIEAAYAFFELSSGQMVSRDCFSVSEPDASFPEARG